MTRFNISILGCGSALPTTMHNPPSQIVNMNEKLFMIDCGEGTQLQMRHFKVRMNRLHSVFISHLHGDHVFGLLGLISTLNLLGRKGDLNIYAHEEIHLLLDPVLKYFCSHPSFKVNIIHLPKNTSATLMENKSIKITAFPLNHRIPTSGFLFEEKERLLHIKREMIDFYDIPITQIKDIKSGADFLKPDGSIVKNELLTYAPSPPRRYAYCSDTAPSDTVIPHISGVDALYHEATFADSDLSVAQETFHSTARQAAEIALKAQVKKLIIGHFSSRYQDTQPLLQQAKEVFKNVCLANEGLLIEL